SSAPFEILNLAALTRIPEAPPRCNRPVKENSCGAPGNRAVSRILLYMQPQSKDDPVIYLHGFASGPGSTKARFFRDRIPHLRILDLAQGDFARLTISGQLHVIEREAMGSPSVLIGSSLGGYL